jgi:toxin ParE1/3/4
LEQYKVIIKSAAKVDLQDIFRYITETLYEPRIAERVCNSIETAILSLRQFPMRHGIIGEEPLTSKEIRKMPVENYIVFYTVDNAAKGVHVLRILFSRREWQNLI